jgi:hypothetical protein
MVQELNKSSEVEAWFDSFISTLRSHQLQLETSTASSELKNFYETLFGGNPVDIAQINKSAIQQYFVRRIIFDYLDKIKKLDPIKLAFDFNDSEVMVWVEIEDGNSFVETQLIKIEAYINSMYHQYGFDMETTIVEQSDNHSVPNHYRLYKSAN